MVVRLVDRLSLRGSIIALIIAIGVIGPLAAGWVHHSQLVSRARAAAERTVAAINAEKAFQVSASVNEAVSLLGIIEHDVEGHLSSIKNSTSGRLDEVFVLDGETGEVLESTDRAQLNKIRSEETYFNAGRQGLYIGPPVYDLYRRKSVSTVAMPARRNGRLLVLGAVLSPVGFAKVLQTKSTAFKSEDSYLISSGNLLVSPPRLAADTGALVGGVHETFVNRCIAGQSAVEDGTDYRGVAVIVSYRWIETPAACLVTQIDIAEFDETLSGVAASTALIALAVVGGSLVAAFLVFAPLFRRISNAVKVFHSVSDGDTTARLTPSVYRELQTVTQGFAMMVEERSRSEDELDAARLEAETANRTKSRFLAAISHELRTPLTGVLGMLDLTERRRSLAEVRHDIEEARTAGRHLLSLINQVLDFSKIEANKIELTTKPFDPEALIRNAAGLFEATARAKGITIETERTGILPEALVGDAERLAQVLFNLVGNAVKFTAEGRVTVRYGTEPSGTRCHRLRVEVIDTGPGISSEGQALLFREFSQIDRLDAPSASGTGLGLAISAGLMTRMGGNIGVSSGGTGTGSTFYIDLELEEGDRLASVESKTGQIPSRPLVILLADDVPLNRDIIAQYLTEEGHTVDTVGDGVACLERLRSGTQYDAVLMDVNMPVLDGVEATRWIRAEATTWSQIPIIGLTADAFTEQRDAYRMAGMTDCLPKPIEWDQLLSALASVTGVAGASIGDSQPVSVPVGLSSAQDLEAVELLSAKQQGDLMARLGHGRTVSLTHEVLTTIEEQVDQMASLADDPERVRAIGHAVRGVSGNVGLTRIASGAGLIEAAARADQIDVALINALRDAVAATRQRYAAFAEQTSTPHLEAIRETP
ncbi:Multi-sensor Hybrid Histidine Kinase [alpha proteobacterium BAL199]|nr:Multi-sensor Hybrid Histidine Kinase [alpha proteobacterium BAL199]